jgi:hypothetical protein
LNETEDEFKFLDVDQNGVFEEWEAEQNMFEMNEFYLLVGERDGNFSISDYAATQPNFTEDYAILFDSNKNEEIDENEWI